MPVNRLPHKREYDSPVLALSSSPQPSPKLSSHDLPALRCGDDKQDVKHILTRCRLLQEERREVRKEAGVGNVTLEWLLYDKEGAQKAETLWKAFEEKRRGWEQVEDEDEEVEERDRERGRGDVGREANNEANLAERGYGE